MYPSTLAAGGDEAVERRELMLQTFGNLTLVTPEFNTKLSNREFKAKKREIKRASRRLLNRCFWEEELQDWDEVAIRQRSRDLFDLARRQWPHPASPPTLETLALDSPPDGSWRIPDEDNVIDEPPRHLPSATQQGARQHMAMRGRFACNTCQTRISMTP